MDGNESSEGSHADSADGAGAETVVRDGSDPAEQRDSTVSGDDLGCGAGSIRELSQGKILLALDGDKALQARLSVGEFRGKKRFAERLKWMDGTEVEEQKATLPTTRIFYVDHKFCCDCGRKGVPCEVPGLEMITADKPAASLDMRQGDLIAYYICDACFVAQRTDGQPTKLEDEGDKEFITDVATDRVKSIAGSSLKDAPVLVDRFGADIVAEHRREKWHESHAERMKRISDNARGWCRAAKLNGGNWQEVSA